MNEDVAVAATTGVAQVFDLHALKDFASDKRVRKMLFKSGQLWSEMACYEPGQSTVMHAHPREEEAIFVLQGTAHMSIAGEEVTVPAEAARRGPRRKLGADDREIRAPPVQGLRKPQRMGRPQSLPPYIPDALSAPPPQPQAPPAPGGPKRGLPRRDRANPDRRKEARRA